ncbi:MAG: anthrone oxygenase family protein [Acidobacteriaceae bacterium]
MILLTIVTTVCIGVLVGVEFAVSVFLNPVIDKLEPAEQANAIRLFAARLGKAMPPWYVFSLVLLIIEAIVQHQTPGEILYFVAGALWAIVIVLTILFLVPINNRMTQLSPGSFPDQARHDHRKWDALHRLRVVALAVSMVCFLLAAYI